jgi:hypothetical protein
MENFSKNNNKEKRREKLLSSFSYLLAGPGGRSKGRRKKEFSF